MVLNRIAIMFLIINILFMILGYVCYINNYWQTPPGFEIFRLLSMPAIILLLINLSKKIFKNKYFQIFANIIAGFIIVSYLFFIYIFIVLMIFLSILFYQNPQEQDVYEKKHEVVQKNIQPSSLLTKNTDKTILTLKGKPKEK